eukprot:5970963-Amphidinium_carterae.1
MGVVSPPHACSRTPELAPHPSSATLLPLLAESLWFWLAACIGRLDLFALINVPWLELSS